MPKQLQLIFDRTLATEQELKEIKSQVKEALSQSNEYQKVLDEIKARKERKLQIENAIKEDFSSELSKMDTLKTDIQNDKMLLSDEALSSLVRGEHVEVEDKNGFKYEPIFTVKFKKIN